MTKEEKQLLLKDLSARLSYKTYVKTAKGIGYIYAINTSQLIELSVANNSEYWSKVFNIDEIKLYLRPISSLTAEECDRLFKILNINGEDGDWLKINDINVIRLFTENGKDFYEIAEAMDYLYSIHVDFRNMISKGLAIEAPKEIYKTK